MQHYEYIKKCNMQKLLSELTLADFLVQGLEWRESNNTINVILQDEETKNPASIVESHIYTEPDESDNFGSMSIEDLRSLLLRRLSENFNQYVDSHYDTKTILGMIFRFILPETPQAIKDAILAASDWLMSVFSYYYQQEFELKDEPNKAKTIQVLIDLFKATDFSQFDASNNHFSLSLLKEN